MVSKRYRAAPALLVCCLLALAVPASARDLGSFSGVVVGVSDGDTIRVLAAGREVKIRLNGVDAPESRQAFGARAKQFTSALVFGKLVRVEVKDRDRYGRLVADVWFGRWSVNQELIRASITASGRDF